MSLKFEGVSVEHKELSISYHDSGWSLLGELSDSKALIARYHKLDCVYFCLIYP